MRACRWFVSDEHITGLRVSRFRARGQHDPNTRRVKSPGRSRRGVGGPIAREKVRTFERRHPVDTANTNSSRSSLRYARRLVPRGESTIALVGLGAATIMLGSLAASTAWTMYTQREQQREQRRERTTMVANLLAEQAAMMLADGRVSALRSSVAGVPAQFGLAQVRVELPDAKSTVIADSSTAARYEPLPETWTHLQTSMHEPLVIQTPGATEVRVPIDVPAKGPATLIARMERDYALIRGWQLQVGAGLIGVAAMGCLWIAYRTARSRLRGVGAVREALQALSEGETSAAVLSVSPSLGGEAVAWNRLVSEAEQLRERLTRDHVNERLGARRGGDTELHSVCDALWQGLMLIDDALTIRYANGASGVFLGVKREDMISASASAVITDQSAIQTIKRVATGASRARASVEITRTGDGAKVSSVLRFTVRPVRKADSAAALVVIEDVTQQRVADDSRNAFVASATHELRTPLTNMRLYVDQLVEEPDLEAAKRSQALNVVSGEIRRLERLVGDMLSIAEIEAGQLKLHRDEVRLETVFEELKHDFEAQARSKQITLTFDLPPKWPQMIGDRDKIVLAMHNLVGNAIKYTPPAGTVSVRVDSDTTTLTVDVTDNGIGIAEDECELIFDKFYRAKDKRIGNITGTGLGLSIAREVVRMHGGELSLRSQIDKGSTFTVSLPLAA